MFQELFNRFRRAADRDMTEMSLKMLIIAVALFWVIMALSIKNKWLLAGIAAYLILP